MSKKIISYIICFAMIASIVQGTAIVGFAGENEKNPILAEENAKEPILAYVPLDNRPVNVERVIYEAESAGFTVAMPDEDLYATKLDGQPLNSNGTPYGDSEKILEWILEMDKKTDYFVISLDQLLSGGLVNSRTIYNTKYFDEYKIINEIVKLSQTNNVYIVDTVARLATCTVGYQNADINTYNYLRYYSMNPRYVIKNKDLNVNNIVSEYKRDEKGRMIPIDSTYKKEVNIALKTRERKLRLIDYMLSMDSNGRMKYFIGIDDSNPQNTIQTNEVNYLKKKLGDRGMIYSGADELGMMAVLNLMIDYYGYDVNVATKYFGETEATGSGSVYDLETVKENVDKHLKSIGVNLVEKSKADIEVVVLTAPSESILNSKYISRMIDYINKNIEEGIPTIVINSAPSTYSGNLEYRMIRECEMSMLLSYSSWGTVGNSIGLALCNGISRYLYLHSRDNSSDTADIAFLKGMIFALEKDISYIRGGGKTLFNRYLEGKAFSTSNFYQSDEQVKTINKDLENLLKTSDYNVTVNDIINNLTGSRYLKGLGGECGIIGKINIGNYSAPFFRTYEIRFDIDVKLKDLTLNGVNNPMSIKVPYEPKNGEKAYSLDLYYLDEKGKMHKVPSVYDKNTGTISFATDKLPYFFTNTFTMTEEEANSVFSDFPTSAWYFGSVMYVFEKGLMKGTTGTTFEPKAPITYAMLSKIFERMDKNTENPFKMENSKESVTREALADLLWQFAQHQGIDVTEGENPGIYNYADVFAINPELRDGFDWACKSGVIAGTNGGTKLSPQSIATRSELAVILKRFIEL
ncbi:MAG: DUF4127 family protein [Aminipila sp.]